MIDVDPTNPRPPLGKARCTTELIHRSSIGHRSDKKGPMSDAWTSKSLQKAIFGLDPPS